MANVWYSIDLGYTSFPRTDKLFSIQPW
jgi:hypothetical protein